MINVPRGKANFLLKNKNFSVFRVGNAKNTNDLSFCSVIVPLSSSERSVNRGRSEVQGQRPKHSINFKFLLQIFVLLIDLFISEGE